MVAFEQALPELESANIRVIAASTDPQERARETAAQQSLSYPVGYGLPLHETAAKLGAFYEERRGILHATGFVLRPGGSIAVSQYSSGPIGRLVADDVVRLVRFYQERSG